jgi:hypothetical protein
MAVNTPLDLMDNTETTKKLSSKAAQYK